MNETKKLPPLLSGANGDMGHMAEFSTNYIKFLARAEQECGELAEFNMAGQETVLMSGPDAQEVFFRASDEQLSQAAAYQVMVPLFGPGVIFDATPERRKTQLKIQVDALRYQNMKNYAAVIAKEVEDWIADWGDAGEREFFEEFQQLTLHTATHCLLGSDFRYKMTDEFKKLYRALEAGLQAIAFVDPYMQQPLFAERDRARERLEEIVAEIVAERRTDNKAYGDALETFMNGTYKDGSYLNETELTGLVIATMFAGHHTSSGVATWTLTELARNPRYTREIVAELDEIFKDGGELSHHSMRDMPKLEGFIREVLRMHPPLVVLMRRVMEDLQYKDYVIPAGKTVAVSTYGSHRNPDYFPEPNTFNPYREEPGHLFAYIPFGGGRHKCGGNAFAILQLKAIFAALLRRYTFELVEDTAYYVDDVSHSMTLRPTAPCRLRYTRRA